MDDLSGIWTSEAVAVADLLERVGAETRVVGGCVRDTLLGVVPKDLDLCTQATPTAMLEAAAAAGVKTFPTLGETVSDPRKWSQGGLKHGMVSFVVNGEVVEATTLRRDVETDGRHATVALSTDFREDAARRDFTFNAMSVDRAGHLHDQFGGGQDLRDGIVRFVGAPGDRMREDYLRILRYFRFRGRHAAEPGSGTPGAGRVHEATMADIARNAQGLSRISGERIWQEVSRILSGPNTAATLADMARSGAASAIRMPVSPEGIRAAGVAAGANAGAAVALGLLAPGAGGRDGLARLWRMGSDEAALFDLCAARAGERDAPFARFLDAALDPRARRDHLSALLVGFGRIDDARRISAGLPEFPLRGADLVAAGMSPGQPVGEALSVLRGAWRESGYSASAEELLAGLGHGTAPRPR